jgi:hypothetical protein
MSDYNTNITNGDCIPLWDIRDDAFPAISHAQTKQTPVFARLIQITRFFLYEIQTHFNSLVYYITYKIQKKSDLE